MHNDFDYEVQLIDFKLYQNEIIELRNFCWNEFNSEVVSEEFYSKQDEIEDLSSIHCGIIQENKLVATHRLQLVNSIDELPYSSNFKDSKVENSKWLTYKYKDDDYVVLESPVAGTGRLVVHPDYRKRGISKLILTYWIKVAQERNIKSLLSYPSPWMVKELLELGFSFEKNLKGVFKPLPTIDLALVTMKF